jgi:alkylation response protein AidB-like acyl-CoA dehydrogenase
MAELRPEAHHADTFDGATILANARGIASVLREEAAENERRRQLTPRAVDALRTTGVFRMPMPRAWGGPEVDIVTQVEIIEELSRADGSAGWCAMIGSDGGYYTAPLDDAVGRALYPDLDAVTAGWIQPAGRLHPVDGGYLLSGHWQFGSACTFADVIVGGCLVAGDGGNGAGADGLPEYRVAILPADRFEILDTWHPTGLAGSGSHDYTIRDAFVPAEQTFRFRDRRRAGTLYAWPGMFPVNLLGVPLGIASAALDTAEGLLAEKLLLPEMVAARDDPRVRTAVARAAAVVGSSRSYVYDVVGDFWATLDAGDEPSSRKRAALGGVYPHTIRSCREAIRLLADTVGSASIHRSCPLERHLRDLTTVSQHALGQLKLLDVVGALQLGADISHPFVAQKVL